MQPGWILLTKGPDGWSAGLVTSLGSAMLGAMTEARVRARVRVRARAMVTVRHAYIE